MNTPISLKDHLPLAVIEERYRKAKEGVGRSHWQILWLLARGKTTQEIAEVTGYSALLSSGAWFAATIEPRPEALGDRRHDNPGGKSILSATQQNQLQGALDDPTPDDELWTGP